MKFTFKAVIVFILFISAFVFISSQSAFANNPPVISSAVARKWMGGKTWQPVSQIKANSYVWFNTVATDSDGSLGYPVYNVPPWNNPNLISYIWQFDDGGPVDLGIYNPSPVRVYLNTGSFIPKVTVYDNLGATSIANIPLNVAGTNQSPVVSVKVNGQPTPFPSVTVNTNVQMGVVSSDPDGTIGFPVFHWLNNNGITRQIWSFGDGVNAGLAAFLDNTVHKFTAVGTYPVSVKVWDNDGASTTYFFNLNVVPLPPSSPVLNSPVAGNAQVSLSWNSVSTATGYKVKYGTSPGVYSNVLDAGNNTNAVILNLINGTIYYFAVAAYNAGGESGNSNEKSAAPQLPAPTAPALNNAATAHSQVDLSWSAAANAAGYKVKYGTASGSYTTVIDVGNITNYSVGSLTNGTTYYFAVTAYNATGESGNSNELNAVPNPVFPVYGLDQCNGGISNASSCLNGCSFIHSHTKAFDDVFNVSNGWVAAGVKTGWLEYQFTSPKKITQYTINAIDAIAGNPKDWTFEGFDDSTSQWVVLDTQTNQGWAFPLTRKYHLTNYNSYSRYRLNISNNGGHVEVGLTEMEMMESVSPGIPHTISDLRAELIAGVMNLSWNDAGDGASPIDHYEIQYGTVAGGQFNLTLIDDATPGAVIPGLNGNTLYQFRVIAVNAFGASDPSNTATATFYSSGSAVLGTITSNTTWNLANSPYRVVGDVLINSGVTLTIDPGVEVRFSGNYSIRVNGVINAQGASNNLIVFTSDKALPAPGDWKFIQLFTAGSILNYVKIEYSDRGVYVGTSNPSIQNSLIQYNNYGIYFEPSSGPSILNNTIINNVRGIFAGCNSFTGCSPVISNNSIYNNSEYSIYAYSYSTNASGITINAINNWWGAASYAPIAGSIYDRTDDGILPFVNFLPYLDAPSGNSVYEILPPALTRIVPASQQVALTWTAVSFATGYKIHYGTSPGVYDTTINTGNVTNYTVSNLVNGTKYYFAVSAFNAQAQGPNSNEKAIIPGGIVIPSVISADTTFNDTGYPYYVLDNVTVNDGVTLTINAGVEIYFMGNYQFAVNGIIKADGAVGNEILFSSGLSNPGPGSWNYISLYNPQSYFNYVRVEYADRGIFFPSYDTAPFIQHSIFRYNNNGLYLNGYAAPKILNNTITENTNGIFIQCNFSVCSKAVINKNSITNNSSYNVYVQSDGSNSASLFIIDAAYNYWGTTDVSQIAQKIWDKTENSSLPLVNIDPYLKMPYGDSFKITDISVSSVFVNLRTQPTINFNYSMAQDADMTIKIYDNATKNLVRTLLNHQPRLAGSHFEPWDLKNGSGVLLPPGLYVYRIEAVATDGSPDYYGPDEYTDVIPAISNTSLNPSATFSPSKGERITIQFDLDRPAQVSVGFEENEFISNKLLNAGSHVLYWDGWGPNGLMSFYQNQLSIDAVAERIPAAGIILDEGRTIDISLGMAEPYIIRPLYNEVATIYYSITESADLTVSVLSPNGLTELKILENNVPKTAGSYQVIWNGRDSSGGAIVTDGNYRIRIKARDAYGAVVTRDVSVRVLY